MDKTPGRDTGPSGKTNPALEQRNAANLKRTLGQALLSFEKNKEWADYGHWLQKVAKCLEDHPSYQIPEKLTFAKRLAQCLNPNLPPAIHNNTIQVYSLIFRNMREAGYNWCEDLGLYSIGIFPLFQYASFQVKPKILALYREHYFPLEKQLIPCITGLVVSILPGVDEQNEGLQKDVFSTLDQLSVCVTRKYFIGAVWMAVLRNSKVRQAGIKYLSKRLRRTYVDPEENENDDEGGQTDSEGEEEPAMQVRTSKTAKMLEETGPVRKESAVPEKKEETASNVTGEADISSVHEDSKGEPISTTEDTTRYVKYQVTPEDEAFLKSLEEENGEDITVQYPNKSSLVINALIACLEDENVFVQKVCLDFMHTHFRLASDLFTELEKHILIEAALNLLIKKDQQIQRRIYTWMFGPPDMENKYQVTEKNIMVIDYLIIAFKNIFNRRPTDSFQATLPLKVLQNFYMEHDHLVEQTLSSLAIPFLSYILMYSQPGNDFADEVHKSGARFMENITSYFSTLLTSLSESLEHAITEQNNERCLEIINLIEFTFKLEASISNKEENMNYIEQKDYLKAIISGILRSVSSISPDQKSLVSFIDTALNLNLNLIIKLEKVENDLVRLIQEKHLSEAEVAKIMEPRPSDYNFVGTLDLFSKFYERLVDQILAFQSEGQIPQKILNLFAAASETIVKVQVFHIETSLTTLPSWIHSVLQCIRSSFPAVAIIGVKTIQSLLVSKSKRPIYDSIKSLITSEGGRNKANDIVRRTMEKLWGLLDIHYIQNTVSDLLVTFQNHFPKVFADTVSNSFHVPSITEKEAAIRRFASFWKMSNDMPKSDFIDSGTGLFIMLDFLDNDNPLLRHSSKSWLLDSVFFLFRIIDPIFEILMQMNSNPMVSDQHHLKLYVTETKQYFFTDVYDTDIVQDSFRKLKSILITSNELFIQYIIRINISDRLKNHTQFFESNDLKTTDSCTYLDLLVVLCLRYIQGHAIESLSPKFQIQNASVNASASEFMELLVSRVENKELSAKMTHFIMEPLLFVLHHSINNADYVLQVQILNLFKVILFQSSFCQYEEMRYKCVALLSSKRFIPNLLKGLNVDQPYVRVQFINFISLCIGVLTENLPQKEVLTNLVISILRAYFEIILNKHLEISENNDEFEPWENDNMNFEDDILAKKIEMHTDEAKKTAEGKRAARNTFTIRYQNQNEIYILLEGVKKILDYFLKFKPQYQESPESSKHPEDTNGVFGYMKDILTLQFLIKPPEEKKEVTNTPQNSETCKAILNDLFKIVYIFIYCWRLSKEFRQCADFTALGITPYSFEKYNEINKMIKDCHMKIDPNAKSVKSLIISVLKPLMYQYTNDTINSFINYWILECQKKHDLSLNPRMMKEIEILVSMNVSAEMFITALSKNQIVIDLSNYYIKRQQQNKKGPTILNYDVARAESQIFFLLYTYVAFSYIDINFLKKDYLIKLWTTAVNFTKLFTLSKSASTHLWLLEIFFLLSLKYNPKEILNEYKLKKEMHAQINALLIALAHTCAKTGSIYFNEPGGMSEVTRFKTVLPFPPTIYETFKQYVQGNDKFSSSNLTTMNQVEFQHQEIEVLLDSIKIEKLMFQNYDTDTSEHGLYDRYRLFAFKTLKRVGLTLIQNSYSPERIDRIIKRMKDFMEIIFPLMENKSPENQPFLECASELLYSQLDASRSFLIKDYKKNILDIFNGNDFFKCTKQTLKYWSKVIDWVVSMDKSDLFSEFLTKVSAFSFLYSKDSETKQKIKSFERICFIIYSGERDKYQDKLFILLEKMGEVIKNADSAHPSLLILVLFCVRILILRLSPSSLNELFRHIWPILLTLLMQIFNKKNAQKNPNLILAALKLIEMMSIVQLEEFYINQWVFVFDYFGLTIEPMLNEPNSLVQSMESGESGPAETKPKVSNFIYQPYITSVIQDNLRINYKSKQVDTQKDCKKVERKIVMTMTNVDDEVEIKAKALFLIQYLIQQNEFRTQVDPHQIESLIEGDFISLDDYIFNIN